VSVTREDALKELYALAGASTASRADSSNVSAVEREIVQVTSPAAGSAGPANTQTTTGAATSRIGEQLAAITSQLDLLRAAQQTQTDAVAENTKAIAQSVASKIGQSAVSTATSFLGGIGLSPIVSGLLKLFGGGNKNEDAAAAPVKYAGPESVQVSAGLSGGQLREAGYAMNDRVRAIPQVTVQVQAMDSRSFMDRSDDIARAVRQAMLESHAINDVVQEL